MITTTLKTIREHGPCQDGWEKLLKHLGKTKADDEPLGFRTIYESNGLDDTLWCLRAIVPEHHKLLVSLACDFAERAMKHVPDGEQRPAVCLQTVRRWLDGETTLNEVRLAAEAADAAEAAARAAWTAAEAAAAWAARAAARAAEAADAAEAAAAWAARAAAEAAAARAAWAAARAAARAAWAAEKKWQAERLLDVLENAQ